MFHCFCIAPPTCWMAVHPSQHWPLRIQHVQRGDGSFLQVPSRLVVRNVPRLVPAVCPFLSVRKTPTGLSVWIAAPVGVGLWGCDVLHAPDVTGQASIKEKPFSPPPPAYQSAKWSARAPLLERSDAIFFQTGGHKVVRVFFFCTYIFSHYKDRNLTLPPVFGWSYRKKIIISTTP